MARNQDVWRSLNNLNLLVAVSLMVFAILSLIQVRMMSGFVGFVEAHAMLPLAGSLVAVLVLFASSSTRNPDKYHPIEMAIIAFAVGVMLSIAFFAEVENWVINNNPVAGGAIVVILLLAGAIMGR